MKTAIEVNLKRAVLIFVSKDGTFLFARKGTKEHRRLLKRGFLACASTNTRSEAESLQVGTCHLTYDGQRYIYPFDHTVEGLIRAGEELEQLYQHRRSGALGWPEQKAQPHA